MSVDASSPVHCFRLYVAGHAPNATAALANLTAMCHAHLVGRHAIEIIDVFVEPKRALAEGIFMTPTLMLVGPEPMLRVVGTLDDEVAVLRALRLDPVPS
jgi:circadian clock protein KaiB